MDDKEKAELHDIYHARARLRELFQLTGRPGIYAKGILGVGVAGETQPMGTKRPELRVYYSRSCELEVQATIQQLFPEGFGEEYLDFPCRLSPLPVVSSVEKATQVLER